jgi:hypothetical protein
MSSAPAGPLACELTWRAWRLSRVFSLLFARVAIFHILNETLANPGACV